MKFLKTFLFTISLTFLSFGFVTLKGFCASVALDPALSPSVNSNINQFSTFAVTPEYMSIYGPAYIDELNSQLYQNFGWDLETLSWYGEDRFKGYMFGQETNPLNSTDLTPVVANAIANRMMQGTIETVVTAKSLYDSGYNYFSTAVPQWGENAKQWILGKVDSVTGKISEVGSNVVTKITAQGISNYLSLNNNLITNGDIQLYDSFNPVFADCFKFRDLSGNNVNLTLSADCVFCGVDSPSLWVCAPLSSLTYSNNAYYFVGSDFGYLINSNGFNQINSVYLYQGSTITVDNIDYYVGTLGCIYGVNNNRISWFPLPSYYKKYSSDTAYKNFLSSALSTAKYNTAIVVNYSNSIANDLSSILDRLIGKYVDSVSLRRIREIVDSIPIENEVVDGVNVPVAIPTQEIVDELTSAVDDAVALDPDYALVFEDADAVVLDPDVPLPTPNNQGTTVPEDFPDTIFSPINDSVGSIFDFVSIFEPLFYIFSFSAGLLGLWLVVPFVILFLILFRLLK